MPTDACGFWSNDGCEGTPYCPPRCPRFVDRYGTPYLVLPLDEADEDALVEMYLDYAPEHRSMDIPPRGETRIRDWVRFLRDRGTNFVAWRDDEVVGHAGFAPADGDVPEFLVYVHQDFHGRGLGTELTKHAVAYAAADGHDGLTLNVERSNGPAVAIYRRLGFEVVRDHAVELEMYLSLNDPVASAVRLAPADPTRDAHV